MFWLRKKQQQNTINNNLDFRRPNSSIDQIIKPKHKPLKITLLVLGLIIFAVLAWVGIGAFAAISKIITKNSNSSAPFFSFTGNIDANKLNGEGDGRINILLLGVGGAGHPGGQLTDTIMVASIDPQNKKIAFLSIPRDLYVPIEGFGWDKINTAHSDGENNVKKTGGGPALSKKTVSNILDLPIHYYIRGDFDGFTELVDKLGGVQVDVKKAISDPYYPAENMINYAPFYLKAGSQTLDGKTALKFARSRETSSDFDRASRQQQLLVAIKDKALNAGILANPKKITDIIKIIGNHVSTDMQVWEIERLVSMLKDIDTSNMVTKVLDNSADGPLVSVNDGGYYLKTKTGDFKQIQNIAHQIFSDPYLSKEKAKLEVLNATGQAGIAKDVQEMLVSYGYNVVKIDTYNKTQDNTTISDYSSGKNPYTLEFLKKRFNATLKNQSSSSNSIDLTLILGKDYLNNNK